MQTALAQYLGISKHTCTITDYGSPAATIIDGGHLLHVVVWPTPLLYRDVINLYVTYISNHYTQDTVILVFDGYGDTQTTKSLEQRRRAAIKSSADINVILDAHTTTSQAEFLNNAHNKAALITELTKALLLRGVEVRQASGDADIVIALTALTAAERGGTPAAVVSRDTDVLVILLVRLKEGEVILVPMPLILSVSTYLSYTIMYSS